LCGGHRAARICVHAIRAEAAFAAPALCGLRKGLTLLGGRGFLRSRSRRRGT